MRPTAGRIASRLGSGAKEFYRTGLLGPFGQNDLVHYETRLKDGLDDETFSIAMEILAEAATEGLTSTS